MQIEISSENYAEACVGAVIQDAMIRVSGCRPLLYKVSKTHTETNDSEDLEIFTSFLEADQYILSLLTGPSEWEYNIYQMLESELS